MELIKVNKISIKFLLLVIITLQVVLYANTVIAAPSEPLWRVFNNTDGSAVEAFDNGVTPFSLKERTGNEVNRSKIRIQNNISKKRKERKATKILTEIRKVLNSDDVLRPDVSKISVKAKLSGYNGDSVLINNSWLHVGDEISVSPVAEQQLYSLMEELEYVDVRLSEIIEEQIHDKVNMASNFAIKISKISNKRVELVDKVGGRHVINFGKKSRDGDHKYIHSDL